MADIVDPAKPDDELILKEKARKWKSLNQQKYFKTRKTNFQQKEDMPEEHLR
jgi:hypothetical protein